ncbi:unnamed protein product [Peniophora sp. CBMAI 1063]|nr:unnamed protein product [Peniophora sp. CBMAI 1063]
MNPISVRIHVLGLGLSYDDAYTLARTKGVPERYLDTHDVDDALNAYFTRRGHATACMELLPHERPAGTDFEYCIITNFRVVSRHHQSKWNIREERPCADEWTARVSEALLPGADYQSMLMRMTLEDWGAAPAFIERFYKHQSSGKHMIQSSNLSPDQTDYRPIIKERAARVRLQNSNKQLAAPIPAMTSIIPASPATIPRRSVTRPKLRIQIEIANAESTAPLDGCGSDEGYYSDMIVRDQLVC